jgi:hypothetical protein
VDPKPRHAFLERGELARQLVIAGKRSQHHAVHLPHAGVAGGNRERSGRQPHYRKGRLQRTGELPVAQRERHHILLPSSWGEGGCANCLPGCTNP